MVCFQFVSEKCLLEAILIKRQIVAIGSMMLEIVRPPRAETASRSSAQPGHRTTMFVCTTAHPTVWLAGVVVRALCLRLEIVDAIPTAALSSAALGKPLTHMCLCHQTV